MTKFNLFKVVGDIAKYQKIEMKKKKKDITTKELEKALEDVLDRLAQRDAEKYGVELPIYKKEK
tara:strand:+ start:149 stop:340 length:192 start_codon:yes stop_codon:yes gene_type:complete